MNVFDLTGKVAVVTGAGNGLGKAFATALSNAGAKVVVMARNVERLNKAAEEIAAKTGNEVVPIPVDITKEESVVAALKATLEKFPKIDVLINNAAVGRSDTPLIEESYEEWCSIINTNLNGTFLMMKHFGKVMIEQRSGKIINLGSMTAKVAMRNPVIGAYDVSKGGVEALTRCMAGIWAQYGVTVNYIIPGYYMTDINRDYCEKHQEFYKDSLNQIPLGKWGEENDIGNIAVFLASSASDYMTGSAVLTDGGYTVW